MDRTSLMRHLRRRQRLLVAVLLAIAAVCLAQILRPQTETTRVLVAVRDIPALAQIGPDDVAARALPAEAVPATGLTDPAVAVGRRPVGPISAGEIITAGRIAGTAIPTGRTAVPVRFDDDAIASVLSPGDVVDLVADGRVIAHAGVVLRIHRPTSTSLTTVVVVHMDDTSAAAAATAAGAGRLWVTLPSGQ